MTMTIWLIANKKLPDNDYRVFAGNYLSNQYNVSFLLPEKPDNLNSEFYSFFGVTEGVGVEDFLWPLKLFWKLFRCRGRKPIVLLFSTKLILIGPIITSFLSVPSIITLTGKGRVFSSDSYMIKILRPLYNILFENSIKHSEHVLFQNRADFDWFLNSYQKFAHKGILIGSGVDYPVGKISSVRKGKVRVLNVSRLMPDKGICDYLEVANHFKGDDSIDFLLVGPRSKGADHLYKKVLDYSKRGVIEYRGVMNGEDLVECYSLCDIFLFTSYAEGMPRVMIEAGYQGLCPVAYNINANKDLVKCGMGLLVCLKDSRALAHAINDLIHDKNKIMEYALAYQKHITAEYSATEYSKKLLSILNKTSEQL